MRKIKIEKKTRNCFISYHHKNDQKYLTELRKTIKSMKIADYSLKEDIGDLSENTIYKTIRDKMRTCSVTVVLVGDKTGHRKWIDWEIWASLRKYKHPKDPKKSFRANGILVIYLPVSTHSVPSRLQDNIDSGYAVSMKWRNLERDFEGKVNYAYWKRNNLSHKIINNRKRKTRNLFNFFGYKV